MILRLNEKQENILRALANYKFLTYSQMIKLGIGKYSSNLSTEVKSLSDRRVPFVKKIPHRVTAQAKFFLTAKGKDLLVNQFGLMEENIQYPKGTITTDTQDEKHRTSIIDFHIELDLSCKANSTVLVFCDRYFDKVGNNRINKNLKSKTSVLYSEKRSIIPDMVFKLETSKQQELYLLELENGKDTKKAVDKCTRHGKALLNGYVNKKYNFQSGYRVLWIFEFESIMNATIDRLRKDVFFNSLDEYFLFKPIDDVEDSFIDNWVNIRGENRVMYYE